jgi:hypothetical protein
MRVARAQGYSLVRPRTKMQRSRRGWSKAYRILCFPTDTKCSQFQPTGEGLFAGFVSYFAIRSISVPSTEEDRSYSSASAIFLG